MPMRRSSVDIMSRLMPRRCDTRKQTHCEHCQQSILAVQGTPQHRHLGSASDLRLDRHGFNDVHGVDRSFAREQTTGARLTLKDRV